MDFHERMLPNLVVTTFARERKSSDRLFRRKSLSWSGHEAQSDCQSDRHFRVEDDEGQIPSGYRTNETIRVSVEEFSFFGGFLRA